MFFDRGTFWVLPLTYFYLPRSARAYHLPATKAYTLAIRGFRPLEGEGRTLDLLLGEGGSLRENAIKDPENNNIIYLNLSLSISIYVFSIYISPSLSLYIYIYVYT